MRLFAAALVLSLAGCEGCREAPVEEQSDEIAMPPLPEEVPQPGAVYREAYDNAKKEITMDNAHDRLDDIEKQVAREREALE
jgi:hypothetical protein